MAQELHSYDHLAVEALKAVRPGFKRGSASFYELYLVAACADEFAAFAITSHMLHPAVTLFFYTLAHVSSISTEQRWMMMEILYRCWSSV